MEVKTIIIIDVSIDSARRDPPRLDPRRAVTRRAARARRVTTPSSVSSSRRPNRAATVHTRARTLIFVHKYTRAHDGANRSRESAAHADTADPYVIILKTLCHDHLLLAADCRRLYDDACTGSTGVNGACSRIRTDDLVCREAIVIMVII